LTGVGAVGTIVVSIILGNESAAPLRMLFIGLIVFGIAGLQITSTESKEDN
jgi:multidrug transporter EmrE-like cation transporter